MPPITRRDVGYSAAALAASTGCAPPEQPNARILEHNEAMLEARPGKPTKEPTLGLEPLGLGTRAGWIYLRSPDLFASARVTGSRDASRRATKRARVH